MNITWHALIKTKSRRREPSNDCTCESGDRGRVPVVQCREACKAELAGLRRTLCGKCEGTEVNRKNIGNETQI